VKPFQTDPAFEEALCAGAARRSDSGQQAVIVEKLPKRVLAELEALRQTGHGVIDPSAAANETWFDPPAFPVINQHNPPNRWVIHHVKVN